MKTLNLFLLIGIASGFASCAVERQVHSSGDTIEWSRKGSTRIVSEGWISPLVTSASFETPNIEAKLSEVAEPTLEASNDLAMPSLVEAKRRSVTNRVLDQVSHAKGVAITTRMDQAQTWKSVEKAAPPSGGGKSQLAALLLCIFVGVIGIHRFYLGYTWQGIVQLLTLGGCGIWSLVDLIRIITGDLQPKNGGYEKTL